MLLAIDIGGTKLDAAMVAGDGVLRRRRRVPTPATDDPDELFECVVSLATSVCGDSVPVAVGVGCPGPLDFATGRVSPVNLPAWRDFPLRERLAAALGSPTAVENDASCFALAEAKWGAARGHADSIGMVVSTGIGAGLISSGRLLRGANGNAGEIGHVRVEGADAPCPCGRVGCLEAVASGTAIGLRLGAPAASAGVEEIGRVADAIARVLADAVTLLDVGVIVLGGSVSLGFGSTLTCAVERAIPRHTMGGRGVPVRLASLGDEAPLRGAALSTMKEPL